MISNEDYTNSLYRLLSEENVNLPDTNIHLFISVSISLTFLGFALLGTVLVGKPLCVKLASSYILFIQDNNINSVE